jgi:hypothetical protein
VRGQKRDGRLEKVRAEDRSDFSAKSCGTLTLFALSFEDYITTYPNTARDADVV